jgi:hypothetical protein
MKKLSFLIIMSFFTAQSIIYADNAASQSTQTAKNSKKKYWILSSLAIIVTAAGIIAITVDSGSNAHSH